MRKKINENIIFIIKEQPIHEKANPIGGLSFVTLMLQGASKIRGNFDSRMYDTIRQMKRTPATTAQSFRSDSREFPK
jgi:hypothetical protein